MKNAFSVALSLLVFVSGSALAAPDIAGVAVGDDFDVAKQKISKINPEYHQDNVMTDRKTGNVIGIIMSVEKNKETVDQFVIMKNPPSNAIWFVARAQMPIVGSRINRTTLINSLEEKYGPDSQHAILDKYGPTSFLRWSFDNQGKLYQWVQGSASSDPCPVYHGISIPLKGPRDWNYIDDRSKISVPTKFASSCGIEIDASLLTSRLSGEAGMVYYFMVSIIDAQNGVDQRQVQERQEMKRNLENEKLKDTKPQL